MPEPIDSVLAYPPGGWPKAMLRVDLITPCTLDEAVYELACLTRRERRGVVAHFNGLDLFAFPHQSVSEIGRTYDRLKQCSQGSGPPPLIVDRWTPLRKLEVLNAIASGAVKRDAALRIWALSDEELHLWEAGLAARGLDGLAVHKLQHEGART